MESYPMSESENATCRKEFCNEPHMRRGNYDSNMVSAMDSLHDTTTDWTLCFKCNYWLQQTGKPGLIYQWEGETDWRHYVVGPEDSPMKGFDGRKHLITVIEHDANHPDSIGETLETTNLWTQGIIPKEYHKAMENAPRKFFVTIKELR